MRRQFLIAALAACASACTLDAAVAVDEDAAGRVVIIWPPSDPLPECKRDGALVDVSCHACERWLTCVLLGEYGGDAAHPKQPPVCQDYWRGYWLELGRKRWDAEACALCARGIECAHLERWTAALAEQCADICETI